MYTESPQSPPAQVSLCPFARRLDLPCTSRGAAGRRRRRGGYSCTGPCALLAKQGERHFHRKARCFWGWHRFTCCVQSWIPDPAVGAFICFSGWRAHSAHPFRGPLCSSGWPSTAVANVRQELVFSYFFRRCAALHASRLTSLRRPSPRLPPHSVFDALMKKVANSTLRPAWLRLAVPFPPAVPCNYDWKYVYRRIICLLRFLLRGRIYWTRAEERRVISWLRRLPFFYTCAISTDSWDAVAVDLIICLYSRGLMSGDVNSCILRSETISTAPSIYCVAISFSKHSKCA